MTSAQFGSLLRLAFPLIISNLFFTVQISVDRLLLTWLESTLAGAAFAGGMLFYAPFALLAGTAGFSATYVAQYLGSRQFHKVGPLVAQALWFSFLSGLVFMGLAPFSQNLLGLAGHEPELMDREAEYFFCLCFAALPMTMTAALTGMFAGLNRPRVVIWINMAGCQVNGLLDAWLIFGGWGVPSLGIVGAGWATVAGSYASLAVALLVFFQREMDQEFRTRALRWNGKLLRDFLGYAFPNGLQGGFDVVAWTVFTLLVGRLGAAALSATSIVLVVNSWFFIPMLGLAQAVSVKVGQCLGENNPQEAEKNAWAGFLLAGTTMGILGITVALLPGPLLALFQSRDNDSTWAATADLIPGLLWFVALYSVFDSMNLVFAFALRGAGDTRFVSLATLACGIFLLLIPGYLVTEGGWGFYWAWASATLYIAGLAFTFLARFLWGPWRSLRVVEVPVTEVDASGLPVNAPG